MYVCTQKYPRPSNIIIRYTISNWNTLVVELIGVHLFDLNIIIFKLKNIYYRLHILYVIKF